MNFKLLPGDERTSCFPEGKEKVITMVATSSYPGNRVRRSTSHVISPPFGCAPRGLCILATGQITLSAQLTKCRHKNPISLYLSPFLCKIRRYFQSCQSVHGGGGVPRIQDPSPASPCTGPRPSPAPGHVQTCSTWKSLHSPSADIRLKRRLLIKLQSNLPSTINICVNIKVIKCSYLML